MFKKLILLNCVLLFSILGHTQTLSPSVLPSAAGTDIAKGIRLDWTLGELAIETASTTNYLYTQGFHQPVIILKSKPLLNNILLQDYSITVFPNPVTSSFNVAVKSKADNNVYLTLTDFNGRIVYSSAVIRKGYQTQVDMRTMASGVYLLSITNPFGVVIGTYKIVKAA
jgi:hypothetical protein